MVRRGTTDAAPRGGRAERAIREALDTFAAGPVRDEILRRALASAGLSEVPEGPRALRELIGGPLREAVESLFDAHTADALAEALEPIVGLAETGGEGAQAGPSRLLLLCLELAPALSRTIAERASGRVSVLCVEDPLMLAEEVRKADAEELCVLLDSRDARPRAGRMGAVAKQLPAGARVVVWGAAEDDARLLAVSHGELEWLPIGSSATVDEVVALCTVPSVSGARRRPSLPDRSILIVLHDAARRRALAEHVGAFGFAVTTAGSGAEALAKCSRSLPALLIVDQALPGMSGPEVARLLRNAAGEDAPPVILLVRDVVETADLAGVAAAIPEGVSEEKLALLLRKLVGQWGVAGAPARSDIAAKKTPHSE